MEDGVVVSREEMIQDARGYMDCLRAIGDDSAASQLRLMPPEQQQKWCVLGDGSVVERRVIPEEYIPEEYK